MSGFLGSQILEAAIGLAVVYMMLALFCTTVNEWIATLLQSRASNLRTALHGLLDNQDAFTERFYTHPLITGLVKDGKHPSWLPSRVFSQALVDLVTPSTHGAMIFEDLKAGILNLPPGDVRTALLALIQNTEGDIHRAQANIENWFNDSMDRASAWYKRRAQYMNIVLAIAITIALNADTLAIFHRLWSSQASVLLGWENVPASIPAWLARVSGWCLTIGAVSLGAPFWFDLVGRISPMRAK